MQVHSIPCTSLDPVEEDSHHRFPDGLRDTPQLGIMTHNNLLFFTQRLGSGCRRRCFCAEGAEGGIKLPGKSVRLLSLQSLKAMGKEKGTEADVFQGSHMVPTDEAV